MSTHPFRPMPKNGHHPVAAVANEIPIIGQPFKVHGGFATVSMTCTCEAKTTLLLIGASPGACPACRRVFVVQSFAFSAQTGQIQVSLGMAMAPESAPDEVVGSVS